MSFGASDPRPKNQQGPTLADRSLQQNVESLHQGMNQTLGGDFSRLGQDFRDIPSDFNRALGMLMGGESWQDKSDRWAGDYKTGLGKVGQFAGDTKDELQSALSTSLFGRMLGMKPAGAATPKPGQTTPTTTSTPTTPTQQQDPNALALQMFFTSVIAPYLNQISGQMQQSGQNYGQALQGVQGQLNPAIRQYFNPAARQAQVQTYANALAGAAAAGPEYDRLLGGINEAADAQRFLAYQEMQNRSQTNQAGAADAFIQAFLGTAEEGKEEKK